MRQNEPAIHAETAESAEMMEFLGDTAPLSTTRVKTLVEEPTTTCKLYVPEIVGTYDACATLGSVRLTLAANENEDDDAM